ncbi:unnamed protein product [Mytilus edulis]|uniref:VWFD domain-containing protein n=1 Tax=Mytilus edulis TaxID=6550 RepID=A0A8S3RXP3_MYTED|nr:unnamed protein product [Mytilus edulis]
MYPVVLFVSFGSLGFFDTKTNNVTILADGFTYNIFLDYHYNEQYIYWSDHHGHKILRFKYPVDDYSNPEVILNVTHPTGVAVDPIEDHLYWALYYNDTIYRSNFDGTDATIITDNVYRPLDISIDINNRVMFVQSYFKEIWKCSLNGSFCYVIVQTPLISTHMALDLYDNRIYWTNYPSQLPISSSSFDGTDYAETVAKTDYGYGVDVTPNHIYYADVYKGLFKTEKANSSTSTLVMEKQFLRGIKILKYEGECINYKYIEHGEKRSTDFNTVGSMHIPISDERLEKTWYRIKSRNGDQMPTYPPGDYHCGTYYPVWINGTLPLVSDGNMTVTACIQTENNTCETSFVIVVKNCRKYFVYYLQNTTKNAAYCFGNGPVLCPEGMSSESGYYPGCSSSYPNETVTPYVNATLVQSGSGLVPIFECKFDDIPNGTYVYDVFWFINGINVTTHKNVQFDDIGNTVLTDSEWTDRFTMNMEVTCSLRLRFNADAVPSPFYRSKIFYAGLFPENYEYTVIEGEYVDIVLTQTVPVACNVSNLPFERNVCTKDVNFFQQTKNAPLCSNNIASRDIIFNTEFCGIKLDIIDWEKKKYLRVYGFSDGIYNHQERSAYIRLSTNTISVFHDIWTNISVSEIKVNVLDKDSTMTGRLCQVYNDPHIRTFDGKVYHYMEVGEFVLYRNNKGPYWITLPTGTEIKFTISTWSMFINSVSIKPSIFDINDANGLCGVPSLVQDTSDDFTHRDSGAILDERSFADSWRITAMHTPHEQLFIEEPTFFLLDVAIVIDNGNNTNDNETTQSTETCSSAVPSDNNGLVGSLASPCISTSYSRNKRSVTTSHKIVRRSTSDSDDVVDVKPLEYDDDVNSTKNFTRTFRNGWTEEKANQTCYKLIKDKIPTDLEENGIIVSKEEYIESCIEDIKLTADTTFAKDTVSAMQTYTLMEVLRNETMAMAEKDNSTQTVLEYITSFLCPNNCSGNGNCTKGFCTCTNEYAGDDCSQQIYIPPANISLPTSGLCGTRTRACQRTNIYGYFPSKDVWCNKTHFQVNGDSKTYADPVMVKAEYRSAFMVSVALSGNRKKRSTLNIEMAEGYELKLSNDGIAFSDPVSIIIYDEECYNCNASSISCVVVASCPDFTTDGIDTTTSRESTVEETTQDTTTNEDTTNEDTTAQQLKTTDLMASTTRLTTTIQQTTYDNLPTTNQLPLTSYQKFTQYDSTTADKTTTPKETIQEGGTSGRYINKEVNSRPDFRNVPRINTRPSVSSMTSNTDGQRNFFNDYCQQ